MTSDASDDLTAIYRHRFDNQDLANKATTWRLLVDHVFQQYVPRSGTVLDLGAGNCEFINSVVAQRKIAVDLNPDLVSLAGPGIEALVTASDELESIEDESIDTVFTSNFFEHLPTKQHLMSTLAECHRVTRPGGMIVVLMPNIAAVPGRYWDYLDHHLPLTDKSVAEALELSGYRLERSVPRFLPYTVKDARFEIRPFMISAYLKMPWVWRFLGKQMLVVGRR